MTFKMVALDIDGTLVSGYNSMSKETYDAVHAVREHGSEIVIATGRSMSGVWDILRQLDLETGIAVASNGALVFKYDKTDYELLHVVTFDAREVVHRIVKEMPDAIVAVEEIGVGFRVNRPFPDGEVNGEMIVQTIDELVAKPVTRVVVRNPEIDNQEFNAIVDGIGIIGTNYYVGYSSWLDLAPTDVSKASGLQYVTKRRGIEASDVLAIGDGYNDVEMLQWAGRGVAMGDAPDHVKAAANAVTGSVSDDGVVAELSLHFPILKKF